MKITAKPLSLFLLLICVATVQAQFSRGYEIGINIGTFVYNGDLSPWTTGSWKTPAFVLGFTGHKNISPTLAARLELNFGKLRGDEARYVTPEYRQFRAFAFNSRVTEIVVAGEWSPFGRTRKLSPYAFGGIGYAGMNITRDYSRFNEAYFVGEPSLKETLGQDIASKLPGGVAIFPVGFGWRYKLSEKVSLHGEAAQRFTLNDYIDGFSYAGNPELNDSYAKYSIGIRMSLGNKDPYACPVMRY